MEVIVGAAVIAVGIVVAAVLYSRGRAPAVVPPPIAAGPDPTTTAALHAALQERGEGLGRREAMVARREAELTHEHETVSGLQAQAERDHAATDARRAEAERRLEQIAGMSAARARQVLLQEVEDHAKQDAARRIRQIEEDTKREAERRVRNILSVVMQRLAAGHAAETTVSVVQLASDDMKGRIIGREGRNIRALENVTGVDFIIDDTPGAVVLSGFDGVRRELARITLEKLLQDGRIHPARIEETYFQTKSEMETHIVELGEQGTFDAGVQSVHPELVKLLGRLRFRTSYGQNVLAHSIEVAQLAAMMADELGASAKTAAAPPCCTTSARRSPTRSKAPTPSSAVTSPAATARTKPSLTRWRPTTTRSSRKRSKR